jgi:hypothetical protein
MGEKDILELFRADEPSESRRLKLLDVLRILGA